MPFDHVSGEESGNRVLFYQKVSWIEVGLVKDAFGHVLGPIQKKKVFYSP